MKKRCLLGVCSLLACAISGVPAFAQTSSNPYNQLPTRIIGQPKLTPITNGNPNFVEGKELFSPLAVAYDNSSTPPVLYVADAFNNRVLAFKSPASALKGAPADLIVGQQDSYSTIPQGPGQSQSVRLSEGFTLPGALAVDTQGNLYVADGGNNRIIRYPRPLDQLSTILQADLVIGQGSLQSGTAANRGFNVPSEQSLALSGFHTGLALDQKTGDLWVSDPGNNRVLRFPANQLLPYTQDPTADVVLGQNSFAIATFSLGMDTTQLNKLALASPSGIALDTVGRLYVCDNLARVTMWAPPFTAVGNRATRVLGVVKANDEPLSAFKLGGTASSNFAPPEGVFTIGNLVYVLDTANSRILRYDAPETWAAESKDVPSPAASLVIGQTSFTLGLANRGSKTDASNSSLAHPSGAVFTGTDVWVADTDNNRVLGFPVTAGAFTAADKLLGQGDFYQSGINRVGPNGFYFAALTSTLGGGVAVDYTSNPPRLYLADPGNNRVLGYPDARNVKAGDPAAIVIGQVDFQHAASNIPNGDPLQTSDIGLRNPAGVAVDAAGNLWVADSGNGRVLRFSKPFEQQGQPRASLVLGQLALFGQPQTDQATSTQMRNPWGIAFLFDGSVFVSDPASNRVLLFRKPAGGDFRSGQAAVGVYGQRDFTSNAPGNTLDKLNGPRFISTDTDDRLYVADTGNNRIAIYRQQATQQPSGFPATATIDGLSGPIGVTVSALSGFIWVANTNGNTALRYPRFLDYQLDPTVRPDVLQSVNPLYIALDPQDNPVVTEAINRISFYYPRLTFRSAANQSDRALAPGMVADLILSQGAFAEGPTPSTVIPWPKTLGDLEVVVSGIIAPITDIQPTKVRFQVPKDVPLGQADFLVRRTSTGQVIGSATLTTDVAAPGFYVIGGNPGGAIVAKNPDGTDNGPNNAVKRGDVISLFGTGLGMVANMPEDGTAPSDKAPAPDSIQSLFFTNLVPLAQLNATIKYFGLAPGQVGAFQLDLVVPANAIPFVPNTVVFVYKDLRSNVGPGGVTLITTVYTK